MACSNKPEQLFGCEGKVCFPSFEAAEKVCNKMRKKQKRSIKPYHCVYCNFFHIGDGKKEIIKGYVDKKYKTSNNKKEALNEIY